MIRLSLIGLLCLMLAASFESPSEESTESVPQSNEIFIVANRDDALEINARFTQTMTDTSSNFAYGMARRVGMDEKQSLKAVIVALGDRLQKLEVTPRLSGSNADSPSVDGNAAGLLIGAN